MISRSLDSLKYWIRTQFLIHQLDTPLGYIFLSFVALMMAYVIAAMGLQTGMILLIVMIGLPIISACLFNPIFGISISLVVAILIGFLVKFVNAPFGIALDGLLFFMFFGVLVRMEKERDMSFARSPLSIVILIWVFYNLIQVINPAAGSQLAWVYTVRSMAGLVLLYFVACMAFDSLKKIKFIIKFIIFLAFISALYGLKQEFFGLSDQEMLWLTSDEDRYILFVQWSRVRIFSFFSDPTNFGIFMAYMSTFCIVLMTGPISWAKRIMLGIAAGSMILAMAYAGSRTPFVLVPFGLLVYTLMTLKKEVLLTMGFVFLVGTAFVLKSTRSAVIYRLQSAFIPSRSDDTMQVRYRNQKLIRPYIYSHPFGAGLGSTGVWGKRFTPNSFLAKFPHDSAFVRIAVELGWFGLIIFGAFLFIIIRIGTYYYLRVRDPMIKTLYLALTVVVFQLTLASYPQEAIPILPTSIVFYTLLGVIVRLKDFDPNFQKTEGDDQDWPVLELEQQEAEASLSA